MEQNNSRKIYVLLLVIISVVVIIYGQKVIIPFILSVLFWFLIRVIRKLLQKVPVIGKIPQWILTLTSSALLLSVVFGVVEMLSVNIQQLSANMASYQSNIQNITLQIDEALNVDIMDQAKDYSKDFNFTKIISGIIGALVGLFGNIFTVFFYLVFILLEEPHFGEKLKAMYPNSDRYKNVSTVIKKIDQSISTYITMKTGVSVLTGVLSYFALLIIGVDSPAFWAFLIFILNFIPTIGSLIATSFPAVFAMLQFGELLPAILVIVVVGAIQVLVGSILEPRLVGSTLNVSPLVTLITLALWGSIWGIIGMLISVPITVIIIIILNEFPETRPAAILLSQRVPNKDE
ncbi:AI-2E family transporter [bacterium SCSIO 12741]|nr:AI-2E family transporter [bacterium SCSIO 12741]